MTYFLTPEAEAELAEAVSFYALNVRQLFPIGRYPYSMLYRVADGEIRISAIAHHSRRPRAWRKRVQALPTFALFAKRRTQTP